MIDNRDYDAELTAWAESDAPTIHPGAKVLRGQAARDATAELMEAAAVDDLDSAELVERARGRGRPGLNTTGSGRAGVWRVRRSDELAAAVQAQAGREGRREPEIIRDAVRYYLRQQDGVVAP